MHDNHYPSPIRCSFKYLYTKNLFFYIVQAAEKSCAQHSVSGRYTDRYDLFTVCGDTAKFVRQIVHNQTFLGKL